MAVATDISEVIKTKIQPAAAALNKAAEEQKTKIQNVVNELSKAIRESNRPSIERYLDVLEKLKMPPYASLLPATNNLLGQLKQLEPDDETGDDFKQIASLTHSLGELQGKLERNFARLKELEDMAHKALEQAESNGSAATEEWAAMEAWLKAQSEAAKLHLKAMQTLKQLADDSVEAGDADDLAAAVKKSDVRATWKPTQKEIEDKFSKFCAKCAAAGLSKELQDQLNRDRVAWKKLVDGLAEMNKEMDDLQSEIKNTHMGAAKPQPIDFKALAHALKIDKLPKADERLKAALKLQGSARAKALEELQKDAGVKFTPKDKTNLMNAKAP